MDITVGELRGLIKEAFTEHNLRKTKNMLESMLRISEKFAHHLQFGDGSKNEVISAISSIADEVKGWAPSFARHYPQKSSAAMHLSDLLQQLDKLAHTPFSLFKNKNAEKVRVLVDELKEVCDTQFNTRVYDYDYQKLDGNTAVGGSRVATMGSK